MIVRIADVIDRHANAIRFWLCLGPTIVGFYPLSGLINPFWGSLSGFPMYALGSIHPVYGPHPWFEAIVIYGWPLVILALRVWLSGHLLDWSSRWREPIVIAWALSAFAVVPFYSAPVLFPGWPIWCACE